MSLPISEKHRAHKRKGDSPKTKLPTTMLSKYWPRCPICRAHMKYVCHNCGYVNHAAQTEQLFKLGSELKQK